LKIIVIITILYLLFLIPLNNHHIILTKGVVPILLTVFSTLLGLTFTAFAIIGAFMPNIERDFLATKTFETFITTFKITMYLQLIALILSIADYVLITYIISEILGTILIYLSLLTSGFMWLLFHRTFRVFRITRNGLLGKRT
jgi:hypothetical protein